MLVAACFEVAAGAVADIDDGRDRQDFVGAAASALDVCEAHSPCIGRRGVGGGDACNGGTGQGQLLNHIVLVGRRDARKAVVVGIVAADDGGRLLVAACFEVTAGAVGCIDDRSDRGDLVGAAARALHVCEAHSARIGSRGVSGGDACNGRTGQSQLVDHIVGRRCREAGQGVVASLAAGQGAVSGLEIAACLDVAAAAVLCADQAGRCVDHVAAFHARQAHCACASRCAVGGLHGCNRCGAQCFGRDYARAVALARHGVIAADVAVVQCHAVQRDGLVAQHSTAGIARDVFVGVAHARAADRVARDQLAAERVQVGLRDGVVGIAVVSFAHRACDQRHVFGRDAARAGDGAHGEGVVARVSAAQTQAGEGVVAAACIFAVKAAACAAGVHQVGCHDPARVQGAARQGRAAVIDPAHVRRAERQHLGIDRQHTAIDHAAIEVHIAGRRDGDGRGVVGVVAHVHKATGGQLAGAVDQRRERDRRARVVAGLPVAIAQSGHAQIDQAGDTAIAAQAVLGRDGVCAGPGGGAGQAAIGVSFAANADQQLVGRGHGQLAFGNGDGVVAVVGRGGFAQTIHIGIGARHGVGGT